MGCSQPGSSIHGISQVRVLEWVAISFSRGFSQPRDPAQCRIESPALQADPLPLSQKVYEGPLEQGHPELSWLLSIFSPKAQTEQLRYLLEA